MKRLRGLCLSLAGLMLMTTPALAADYNFETPAPKDFYGSTSYEEVYGAQYNYGGTNAVDFLDPLADSAPGISINSGSSLEYGINSGSGSIYPDSSGSSYPIQWGDVPTLPATQFTAVSEVERNDGSIGTLVIPSLGIRYKAYDGTDSASMRKGVGHFPSTSAWEGNIGLCGHNRGSSHNIGAIKDLEIGDTIRYQTSLGTRTYAVSSVKIISLPAPEGGSFAVTELGDYCFSEKPRSLPAADKTCRYEAAPDGTARLIRAFGQTVGGTCRRYDFDFDAPAAGSDADDLHPVCGNFLEELTLPDSLQVVGSCAFYNCRKLRLLTVGTGSLTMGSDVFLNCFALETIRVQAGPEEPTGLFALVNNITEAVRAEFCPAGTAAPLAALWYPAYWEDIEETPAHILLHTFSGQGYHYRQCFLENKFLPAEYDAIFPQGHDADDANVMAMLCFDRLRYPWQLTEAAAGHYRAFLAANTDRVLARLLKAQDNDAVRALIALDVLDKDGFAEASALAAKAGNAAAAALLADAEHKKYAPQPKKQRYDFDF